MNKKLEIGLRPNANKTAEEWVSERPETPPPAKEKTKRLTVDMPQTLHLDFKLKAVSENEDMAELIRGWIRQYTYSPVGAKRGGRDG